MSNYENFGKYLLLEKIAAGGMAEVYLAKSTGANGVNKFIAIKRILPQFSNNEEYIAMFKEEAKVAINLNHSNVVSIYDFGIEKNQFFLVMEFVDGRNLRQILNELKKANKSVSIDQAIFIVKEAAAGLDHAHRCVDSQSGKPLNITHRDMSPQNIMVSFEGETKVIDFGIAKAETEAEATRAGTLKGKFAYMSPEQSEGLPIDPRTDVFALGIILWELLANDRLFTGSNESAILRKVRECQVPPIRKVNPLVPVELERIVMKALAKDRNVRYQTAANLHRDLNRFLNTQYPDFSTSEFSHFIRDCFKSAYSEARERLVSFARVEITTMPTVTSAPLPHLAVKPPSVPQAQKAPAAAEIAAASKKEDNENLEQPQLKGLAPEQKIKIKLEGVRSAGVSKNKFGAPNNLTHHGKINTTMQHNAAGTANQTRVTHVTQFSQTTSGQPRSRKKETDFADILLKFMFVGVLGFSGYWGYKNYLVSGSISYTKKKEALNKEEGQVELAGTASVKLSITSDPPKAKILIDGKDTLQRTPAIVSVTANQDVSINLELNGYFTYETNRRLSQTSSLSATLQPMPSAGYLNITVENGGANPIVFVNGQRLNEPPPISRYAVPANVEILVRAMNPITQLSDETKVKVEAKKTIPVELILGRQRQKK